MPAVAVNKVFPAGNGQTVTPTGTLTMNDTGVSQDACQGATLTLNLTSNYGGTVGGGAELAIPATGPAISTTRFTYTAPATGNFSSHTITAAVLAGTAYTSATATVSK